MLGLAESIEERGRCCDSTAGTYSDAIENEDSQSIPPEALTDDAALVVDIQPATVRDSYSSGTVMAS